MDTCSHFNMTFRGFTVICFTNPINKSRERFIFPTAREGSCSPAACRFREKRLFFVLLAPDWLSVLEKGAGLVCESWHQSAL